MSPRHRVGTLRFNGRRPGDTILHVCRPEGGRRPVPDDGSILHDDDIVGVFQNFVEPMGDEDDGHALPADTAREGQQLCRAEGEVEARDRTLTALADL